ncbi:hypothetical protein [Kribbella sp. NPDC051620]|uniref:hypothetical protein n=1 Tax=Kribbella sp. NPDC051620 TaxID=3364120 RepID=UPI0037900E0A
MTTQQNLPEDQHCQLTDDQADPIGPITMPGVGWIGSRALALIGAASVLALGINAIVDPGTSTPPTVSR